MHLKPIKSNIAEPLLRDPVMLTQNDSPAQLKQSVRQFLAWGDFHARSRFARSTIPEEKWGTTRSLWSDVKWVMLIVKCRNSVTRLWLVVISDK